MNPAKISIPDCTLDTPVKKSSGKISFCLLPCLHNNERLQVKLATKFKIFSHQRSAASSDEDSFSLGITLPDESKKFFEDLEKHLNALAKKKKPEVKEIGPNFARFQEGDFFLLKTDKSEQEKIYAKIYPSKLPNQDFSCRFWEVCDEGTSGAKKKKPISKAKKHVNIPLRGQVVFSVKHLFCGNVKAITCIVTKFWWRKSFKLPQLLMSLRTGMKMMNKFYFSSPNSEMKKFPQNFQRKISPPPPPEF